MLELIEKLLYIAAYTGQAVLIAIGVRVIMSRKDKLAGAVFILGGIIGLNVLIGRTIVGFAVGPALLVLCLLFWFVTQTIKSKSPEKRQYSRAQIAYPVVLMTPNGPVAGVTQNLSIGGAFVRCSKLPEVDDTFRLVIKPTERPPLLVHAEMVWADTFVNEEPMSHGMGLSFKLKDRQFISNLTYEHA